MSIKSLPSMEHTFTLTDVEGSDTRAKYSGTFTFNRPNIRVQTEIAKTRAILSGGLSLGEDIEILHKILATLRHTLTNTPTWWQDADYGFEFREHNIVFQLYKECQDFEDSWAKKVWSEEEPPKNTKDSKSSKSKTKDGQA